MIQRLSKSINKEPSMRLLLLITSLLVTSISPHIAADELRSITHEAETMLLTYRWPGNIRELRNVIERAMLLCSGPEIQPAHLPDNLRGRAITQPIDDMEDLSIAAMEAKHIKQVLDHCDQNRSHAAELLGIHRATLIKKIQKYQLES